MTAPNDRVVAWGDELVKLHNGFRRRLADLRRGTTGSGPELAEHCLSLCHALHAHHTEEDDVLFPYLDARNPELAEVLVRLRDEHRAIAAILAQIRALDGTGLATELDRLATELETHLDYEEEQLVPLLNAMTDMPEDA